MEKLEKFPAGVKVGAGTIITGTSSFRRFHSTQSDALLIGRNCTLDHCQFSLGKSARISIGDQCYFTSVILMCESEIHIGSRVMIGWNTALADSDFHPIDPALRIQDAITLSPAHSATPRPPIESKLITIEDDVWIGPMVTILKGVTIGHGAFIEPGSIITRDIPPNTRVGGNPSIIIGKI
jgi:acetyltransferase-like isoleucine patch superfamily enzyme